jgi:site-specific DNA-methyltransferase (adenine-specific)
MDFTGYTDKYEVGNIKMYQADCMEMMPQAPDKFFELAIVDPIYGHNIAGGHSSENGWRSHDFWHKATHEWNTKKSDNNYFIELFRVSKNQIIWGGNYFILPVSEGWLVWDKGQREFSLADGELAWTSFDKATRIFNYSRSLSNFADVKIHPTQKPVKLYEWLLKNYAKPGDKILDTHGGSFSSAIACYNLDYAYTGIEIDADYFNAGKNRLIEHMKQGRLYDVRAKRI